MKNKKIKKIISFSILILLLIIVAWGFKVFLLEDTTKTAEIKTVRKIGLEEEKKIFGLETNSETEKIMSNSEINPITVTKTIACGNNNDIYEGQVQTFYITVKNNTDSVINNINVVDEIPEEMVYATELTAEGLTSRYQEDENIKEFNYNIEKLEAGREVTLKYFTRVKQDMSIDQKLTTKAVATILGNDVNYESNIVENTIRESKLQIELITPYSNNGYFRPNDYATYFVKVKNISNEPLENIKISYKIPEQAIYQRSMYLIKNEDGLYENTEEDEQNNDNGYNEENKEVTWNFEKLEIGEEQAVEVVTKLVDNTTEEDVIKIENLVTGIVDRRRILFKYIYDRATK